MKGRKKMDIARELGLVPGNLSMYCNGDRIPTIENFRSLCVLLGVKSDWLLGLSDDCTATTRAEAAARLEQESKAAESIIARTAAKVAHHDTPRERLKVLGSSYELTPAGELVNRIRVKRQDGTTRTIEIPHPVTIPISKTSLHDHELVLVRKKSPRKKTAKVVVVPAKI